MSDKRVIRPESKSSKPPGLVGLEEQIEALLKPLGDILTHMQVQNEHSAEQLKYGKSTVDNLRDNNKRLLLLLVFVGICALVCAYQTYRLALAERTMASLHINLEQVLTLVHHSESVLDATKKEVRRASTRAKYQRVTLEGRGSGRSVVVVRPATGPRAKDAGVPYVEIPVTVPSSLKMKEMKEKE